jgi:hypothetical protein
MQLVDVAIPSQEILEEIQQLEFSLLEQSTRKSVDKLNHLIADDFCEFGNSGKIYNKQDLLKFLPSESKRTFTVNDFEVKELSKDVILVTYKTTEELVTSLRSSIWKQDGNNWRMVFHQGTKII